MRCRLLQALFFCPVSLFPVAFCLLLSQPIFQFFLSLSLSRASSGSQIIYIKRMKRFSASIRGEYWLRGADNKTGCCCGFTVKTFLHLHLLYMANVMKDSGDSFAGCLFSRPLSPNRIPSSCLFGRFTYWVLQLRIWAIPTQLFWQHGESWQGHGDLAWRANFLTWKSFSFLCFSHETKGFFMRWSSRYVRIACVFYHSSITVFKNQVLCIITSYH